jgi:hypothetical protein
MDQVMYQLPTEDEFFSDDYQLPTADEFFDMSPDEPSGQDQPPGGATQAEPGVDPGSASGFDSSANPGSADATATSGAMQPAPGQAEGQNPATPAQPGGSSSTTQGASQSAVVAGQTVTGAGQAGQTAPCPDETAINANDPSAQGAHIYAYKDPNDPKGFSFFAVDDKGSEPVTGHFNRTTWLNIHELPPGDYTLSPRPHIAVKTGLDGVEQNVGQRLSGNWSGDPNEHEGNPVISNSKDWNTVILPDGIKRSGAAIHPGKDLIAGEGGISLGCMVTTKDEYNQLNRLLQSNYAQGGAHLHILPYNHILRDEELANFIYDWIL